MDYSFHALITNKCLMVPFFLWASIQIFKFLTDLVLYKEVNLKRLMGAGGMPSSHSAVVCSLATVVGKQQGIDSEMFAISVILALVVMYDAAGVRRAAGKQAKILNKIIQTPGLTTVEVSERLVEALGHTPIQVFVGAFIGIIVGILV